MTLAQVFQGSLFASGVVAPGSFDELDRTWLDPACWVDVCHSWLSGADDLMDELIGTLPWGQGRRAMYGELVDEPRLTAGIRIDGRKGPAGLVQARDALVDHYQVHFDSAWANFYRDGRDSVAWHGDRIALTNQQPTIALVSLGGPRRFQLRPKGGGASLTYTLHSGDLLVMGGRCQHRFEHCVPKVARAAPRISVSFRQESGNGATLVRMKTPSASAVVTSPYPISPLT